MGTSITSRWLHQYHDLYLSAIRAPFILAIRDGTLPSSYFTRWLGQDYLYVKDFCRYVASVVANSPDSTSSDDLDLLLGGLSALQSELLWFRSQSVRWKVDLEGLPRHETTQSYCRFLKSLTGADVKHAAMVSTLWAIEMVYNRSFASCLEDEAKTPPEMLEACQRWGSTTFGEYCNSLKDMADRTLELADTDTLKKAEQMFEEVLKHEVAFWSMSFDSGEELRP